VRADGTLIGVGGTRGDVLGRKRGRGRRTPHGSLGPRIADWAAIDRSARLAVAIDARQIGLQHAAARAGDRPHVLRISGTAARWRRVSRAGADSGLHHQFLFGAPGEKRLRMAAGSSPGSQSGSATGKSAGKLGE
jgi:hypothetical protein